MTQFVPNLLAFGRLLRRLGMEVDSERITTLLRAIRSIDLASERDLYYAARALLTQRQADLPTFDRAYRAFFWGVHPPEQEWPRHGPKKARQQEQLSLEHGSETSDKPRAHKTYSARERLGSKDFSKMSPEELRQLERMMAGMSWQLGQRRTRRRRPGDGQRLDLRGTTREALMYGGEWLRWSWRSRKLRPRNLILLVDISGSMDDYARVLLQFVYGLYRGLDQHVEAFVFSTRLTRITKALKRQSVHRALQAIGTQVPDWSGGTRIGRALKEFNYSWARRVRAQGSVICVVSDGLDRGDTQLLARETARLRRSCHRLMWLNPLLGDPRYQPLAHGMRTALPHVDQFLPVHNFESLVALADLLLAGTSRTLQIT